MNSLTRLHTLTLGVRQQILRRTLCNKEPRVEMPKMTAEQCEAVESETMVEERPETKEAYKRFPNDINPRTGEVNGPRGPEPTRYGDWERKGRAIDF